LIPEREGGGQQKRTKWYPRCAWAGTNFVLQSSEKPSAYFRMKTKTKMPVMGLGPQEQFRKSSITRSKLPYIKT